MRKLILGLCLGTAAGFLLMSVAVFLCYPGSYRTLNMGDTSLQATAATLFWIGLAIGLALALITTLIRIKAVPQYSKAYRKYKRKSDSTKRVKMLLIRNWLSPVMALAFLVGAVGSVISLLHSTTSSYHTFFFLGLMCLGFSEYFTLNSLNFAYATGKEWKL